MAAKMPPIRHLASASFRQWIDGLDAFLFDCDGGTYRVCQAQGASGSCSPLARQRGH